MKIELRNLKYAAFASEETACFSAAVYIDGAKSGEVSNDGHGGCHHWHPLDLCDRIDAYAKTLPNVPSEYFADGLKQDSDLFINILVEDELAKRDLARLLKSKLVYAKRGKIYTTKKIPADQLVVLVADPAATCAKVSADALLNAMPFDAALALYRKNTGD